MMARSLNANFFEFDDPYSALYQLNGIPFYLKTYSSYLDKNTLSTNGKGQPITIKRFDQNDNSQLFYFQFLPATSGIPFIIRSFKEGTPIGAGSYASNPNNYVLYTQQAGATSLFGFSWDFIFNGNRSGYFIENQDLVGQGSGGWWDVYNYVLQAQNAQISFAKANNSIYQEFRIEPKGTYKITEVVYDYDNVEVLGQTPLLLKTGQHPNVSYTNTDKITLTFSENASGSSVSVPKLRQ